MLHLSMLLFNLATLQKFAMVPDLAMMQNLAMMED